MIARPQGFFASAALAGARRSYATYRQVSFIPKRRGNARKIISTPFSWALTSRKK